MTIDVDKMDFEAILISAFRYALGRQTYIPSIVVNFMRPLLPQLSDNCLVVICKDIEDKHQSLTRNPLGDPLVDKPLWEEFYAEVMDERGNRITKKRH